MYPPVPRLNPRRTGPDFSAFGTRVDDEEENRPDFSAGGVRVDLSAARMAPQPQPAMPRPANDLPDFSRGGQRVDIQRPPSLGSRLRNHASTAALNAARGLPGIGQFVGGERARMSPQQQARWLENAGARREARLADTGSLVGALDDLNDTEFLRVTGMYRQQYDELPDGPERRAVDARIRQERERANRLQGRALENMQEVDAMRRGDIPPAQYTPGQSAGAGAVRSFVDTLASSPFKAAGAIQASITGQSPEETGLYRSGQGISDFTAQTFPSDAARRDEFGQQLSEGAGSAAAFATPGLAGRALGLGSRASSALVGAQGAAAQGASGLDEAIAAGGDDRQKLLSFYANAGLGVTEVVPFSRFLGRLDDTTGGAVARVLRNSAAQSFDEFAQELTQAIGSNVIASEVARYDEGRSAGEGALRAATIGALLGLGGGAATAFNRPSQPGRNDFIGVTPQEQEGQAPGWQLPPDFSAGGTRVGEAPTQAETEARQSEADLYSDQVEQMLQEVRRVRSASPASQAAPTLVQFVRSQGGISDDRGDVSAAAGSPQRAAGVVRPQGRQIDDIAQAAFEAGYFPDGIARPDRNRFIDALVSDLNGQAVLPVDAMQDQAARGQRSASAAYFDQAGININERDEVALRRQLAGLVNQPTGRPRTLADLERERSSMREAGYFPVAPSGVRGPQQGTGQAADFSAGGTRVSAQTTAQDFSAGGTRVAAPTNVPALPSPGPLQATGRVSALEGVRSRDEAGVSGQREGSAAAQTLRDIAGTFNHALGLTVREGRLRSPRSLGEYDPASGVVRSRIPEEMDVLSHEGGHALAGRNREAFNAFERAVPNQLRALAYQGADPAAQVEEGFAEFFRLYTTNREYARLRHPEVFNAFERTFRAAAPQAMAAIDQVATAYDAWLKQPSGESITADIVSTGGRGGRIGRAFRGLREDGFGGSVLSAADRIYTAFLDDLHPINRAVKDLTRVAERNAGGRVEVQPAENAYVLSRLARDAYGSGHMDLMHGVRNYRAIDPEGPSLADALGVALGDRGLRRWDQKKIDALGSYLVSRRAVQEWLNYERGRIPNPPDKFTRGDHEQNIAEMEAANPQFRDAAQMVYEWNNRLWKKKFDAGLLTQEQYEGGLSNHPDYVPFIRDMGPDRGRPGASANNKTSTFREFRGSRRAIINPIESMMRDAYHTAAVIARNDAIRALHDLSRLAGPGSGAIVEEVPATETRAYRVDAGEAFREAARAQGLNERDIASISDAMDTALDGKMSATLFSGGVINERGEPIVFVWRDGKRHALRLADGIYGRDLFSALTGLGAEQSNMFVNLLSVPTQALRMGITAHPEFFLTNFIRDQVSAWVLTDVGFKPFVSGAIGTGSEISQTDWSRRYNAFGGIMGGANVSSMDQSRANNDIQALRKKGYAVRRFGSWRGFGELTEIPETGTRLGLFRNAFSRAKKQGRGDYEAAIEAAFTARDYIDFGRHGSRMLMARRLVPFFNAALQGLDKSTRVLSGGQSLRNVLRPLFTGQSGQLTQEDRARLALAAKAWGKISLLGVLGLTLTALYEDDPEYREISDYLRATHWMLKVEGEWIAIPKPFELAIMSNIFERGYEGMVQRDPQAGERLVSGLAMTIAPPHEIPAISVPAGIAANRDFFTGAPLVPEYMQGLEPHLQFNAYTSEFGKRLGAAVNVSPAVIDHAVTGFGGSWGRTLLELSNRTQPGRPEMSAADTPVVGRFVRDPARGATSTSDFWDQMARDGGEFSRASTTFQHLMRSGRMDEAAAYLDRQSPEIRDWVVVESFMGADQKRMHPMRRAQDVLGIVSGMRREINQGTLEVAGTEGSIPLTASQKRQVTEALQRIAVAEAGHALALTGLEGYERRPLMERNSLLEELRAASPEAHREYMRRLASGRVVPFPALEGAWPTLRSIARSNQITQAMPALMQRERAEALERERYGQR